MNFRFIFVTILCISCKLFGREGPRTISELVDTALANNPETKKTWANAKIAAANVGVERSTYFPSLDLDLSATKGKEFKYINGPSTSYKELEADLTLSWLLFDFGERCARVASAKSALLAANWQADFTIQRVVLDVLENAYEVLHAQETLKANLLSLEDAEHMLGYAQELNHVGLAPVSDVYTSKGAYLQMQMQVAKQKAYLTSQKGALSTSLGLAFDEALEVAPILEFEKPKPEELKVLLEQSKQRHAEIREKQAQVEQATQNLESLKRSAFPKLSVTASKGYNRYLTEKTRSSSYEVSFNVHVPLFSGFETIYKVKMAKAELQTSIEELFQLELALAQEVLSQRSFFEAAQERLALAEKNLESVKLAYQGTLERYRAGKKNEIFEVSSALGELAKARVTFSEVKTEWLVSLAKLAYATGSLTPKDIP
jgi:outer membrane protein